MSQNRPTQTHWTSRAERAIPKLDVPSLRSLDEAPAGDERALLALLVARPFAGLGVFVAMVATGWWLLAPGVLWLL